MPFKNIAVLGGTGGLGAHLVNGLLENKAAAFNVLVYSRPSSVADPKNAASFADLTKRGATVVGVESSDVAALTAQLKKDAVDVVVSAVGFGGIADQIKYIDAAKAAGVKRFIPSEFGVDSETHTPALLAAKKPVREHLKNSGLEWTLVFNGFFLDGFLSGFYDWDFAAKKAVVVGEGNVPISLITQKDIGKFLAAILADADTNRSKNKPIFIQSEFLTWNQAIAVAEDVSKSKFTVTRISVDDAAASLATAEFFPALVTQLKLIIARGQALLSHNHNALWPEVKPQTARDYLSTVIFK